MKIVVLDGYAVNPGDLDWSFLNKYGEAEVYAKTPDRDCIEKCRGAEVVYTNRAKITAEFLDACPTVRYVSALGTGYDMIDISACAARGVTVVNIPDYSAPSVAQHTVSLLLALYSDLRGMQNIVESGLWTGIPNFRYDAVPFTELAGLTLGLIGCGSIGRRVAVLANALGMKVLAVTATPHESTETVQYTSLPTLLEKADVISLHCPLNDSTRGMVSGDFLSRMKKGARLINTSRGAVIDEQALADALNDGHLAGAALDVLTTEPPTADCPLLSAKNCIITPHIAWASPAARRRLLAILEESLADYASGGRGKNLIVP